MSERGELAAAAPAAGLAAVAAQPARMRFSALEVPTFRNYWIASWISSTGDGMENVIRAVLVVQLAGSAAPFWLGMMVFAHWIPFTLFSLYGGVLADRYDNRKVQLVAQVLLMTAAVGVAVATLSGAVTVWWIFGLLLLHGFAGAIGGPAQQTLIHSMVGPSRLLSAVSLNSTSRQFSQVIGPAVAGFIVVAFGPGLGFLVNALTFVPLLVFLTFVRVPRAGTRSRQPLGPALRDGLRFLRGRPRVAALIGVEMLSAVFLGHTFSSFLVLFAYDVLHVDALGFAFLLVGSGIGAVGAALFLAFTRRQSYGVRFIIIVAMVQMIAILLFAFSTSYPLSFALLVAVGAAAVLEQSLTTTRIQLEAPDDLRGRVMGAYTFGTQGMRVLNGPILGGLAIVVGAPLAVAGASTFVFGVLGAMLVRVRSMRSPVG